MQSSIRWVDLKKDLSNVIEDHGLDETLGLSKEVLTSEVYRLLREQHDLFKKRDSWLQDLLVRCDLSRRPKTTPDDKEPAYA